MASPSTPAERFRVEFTPQAQKDLDDYRGLADRVVEELSRLERDPHRGHTLTASLKGVRSLEFSLPGGAQRAGYVVLEDERVCLVFIVRSHENYYREAERRFGALRRSGMI